MGNLVFQATLGGQVNLVGPNTASTYNINVPAVAGTLVTTGDTATVTSAMISGPVSIAKGGTNQTAFTSPAASVNGLVWFDGTSFQNDTSPAHVGYNASTNTFNALNILSPNDASISGLTVGKGAGAVSTNTAVGASALAANANGGTGISAVGYQALNAYNVAGTNYSTALGYRAGYSYNTNSDNAGSTFIGGNAGSAVTTGTDSTFVGASAGAATTSGANNTAIGSLALKSNTTASNNTAVGYQALYANTTNGLNTAVGFQTGPTATGTGNTLIGAQTGYALTTGSYNTFVSANGPSYCAGSQMTTGSKNTIIGCFGGNQGGLDIRTLNNFIVLSDGDGNPRMYYNNSAGTWAYSNLASGAGTNALKWNTTTGYITYDTSSARYKDNIRDSVYGLDAVMAMRSAQFEYKDTGRSDVGLIAEELQPIIPELVGVNKDGEADSVSYDRMVSVLVKAIQELNAKVEAQAAEIAALKGQA